MAAAFIPYGILALLAATVIFATTRLRWLRLLALVAAAGLTRRRMTLAHERRTLVVR